MEITWRDALTKALDFYGEDWADVIEHTMTERELDIKFENDFGWYSGIPFTLWTFTRVYFPWGYDGSEGVASVSRTPDGEPTNHVGGGG